MYQSRSVVILGATGLVGRELLTYLLREPTILSVTALVRNARTLPNDAKLRVHEIDFAHMERHADLLEADQVFCALGTTMRQAGSREQFRAVDHDYPVTAARLARARGATHYLLVSAIGANPSSRIFYNRVKGETERDIVAFDFTSVTIARPSLLLGDRLEVRLGERIAAVLGKIAPPGVRPISAKDVAAALTLAARFVRLGLHILTSREMRGSAIRLSNQSPVF